MARYFADPDFGDPIAGLKGTNYALFRNGTIGEKIDGDGEQQHYDWVYSVDDRIEIELSDPDDISANVKRLNESSTILGYTALLLILYYVFQSQKWSIFNLLIDTKLGIWGLVIGLFLWIIISGLPQLIYEILTKGSNVSRYILVTFHRRPNSPKIIHEGKGMWKDLVLAWAYFQSAGVVLALLIYNPENIENSAFWTLAITLISANVMFLAMLICISLLTIPNIGIFGSELIRVDSLSLNQFFNKTQKTIASYKESDQGPLEERILGGETNSLEFKETYWTETKGENFGQRNKCLQDVIVKVVAGFLNTSGGTLLIGINDDKQLSEHLEKDCTHSKSITDLDKLIDVIDQDLSDNLECKQTGILSGKWVTKLNTVHSNQIIQIEIQKAPGPVLAFQKREQRKKRNLSKNPKEIVEDRKFRFLRIGSSTKERSQDTWENHIFTNWK